MKNISERLEAYDRIKKVLPKKHNNTIYATVTKVGSTGMTRRIKFYTVKNNEIYYITYNMAKMLDVNFNNDGILARGCGMDMIFNTIYNLNCVAYGLDRGENTRQTFESCNSYLFNTRYRSL